MPASPIDEYEAKLGVKKSEFRERRVTIDRRDDSLKRRLLEDRRKTVFPVTNDRRKGLSHLPANDRRQRERRVSDRREYITTNYSQEKLENAIEEKDKNDFNISALMFILSFIIIFGSIIYVFYTEGNL